MLEVVGPDYIIQAQPDQVEQVAAVREAQLEMEELREQKTAEAVVVEVQVVVLLLQEVMVAQVL